MPKKRFSPEEIISMLREADVRLSQAETIGQICRGLAVSEQSYYRWRREHGGLKVSQARRLKDLERENQRLRQAAGRSPAATLSTQVLDAEGHCRMAG